MLNYYFIMILKPTPEKPEQAHTSGNGSSILNRQSKCWKYANCKICL